MALVDITLTRIGVKVTTAVPGIGLFIGDGQPYDAAEAPILPHAQLWSPATSVLSTVAWRTNKVGFDISLVITDTGKTDAEMRDYGADVEAELVGDKQLDFSLLWLSTGPVSLSTTSTENDVKQLFVGYTGELWI